MTPKHLQILVSVTSPENNPLWIPMDTVYHDKLGLEIKEYLNKWRDSHHEVEYSIF